MSSWASRVYDSNWAPAHVSLAGLADEPLFSPEELFETFLAARNAHPGTPGAIYFNHEIEKNVFSRQGDAPTPREFLPIADDRTWSGYSERVKTALGGARFCLRLTEAHAHSSVIYKRLCKLVGPLEAALERSQRCVRTTIFMGDYDYTPFGAHVDPYPQIQAVITGARTGVFWEAEYWKGRTQAERLAPWNHLDAAQQVAMHAGDAVYWAADYEHVFSAGRERSELAIACTISFPEVPAPETEIELARRRSAHHILNIPIARVARDWRSDQLFSGAPLSPLRIVSQSGAEIVIVAGGCAFEIPAEIPSLVDLVERVNEHRPFRLSDFPDEDAARAFVDVLYACYCIDAVDA